MTDAERRPLLDGYVLRRTLLPHLQQVVPGDWLPLSIHCATTGLLSVVSLVKAGTWVAFMTGNAVQLAMAIPNVAAGQGGLLDLRRLLVLLAFLLGAVSASWLSPRGPKNQTRLSVIVATFVHASLLALAAGFVRLSELWWKRASTIPGEQWSDPWGMLGIATLALVLGAQAYSSQQLATAFRTTVVLTTQFVDLVTDTHLLASPNAGRNSRIMCIGSVAFGAVAAELVLKAFDDGEGGAVVIGLTSALSACGIVRWWWVKAATYDGEDSHGA